jgi:hypothetical protein
MFYSTGRSRAKAGFIQSHVVPLWQGFPLGELEIRLTFVHLAVGFLYSGFRVIVCRMGSE